MNLQIDLKDDDQGKILLLNGEVDVYTASKLKETVIPLVEEPNTSVVINLSNVNYIDSTGVGIFIGALKAADKSDTRLKLTGANARVKRLFEITGLDEVIDIDSDQREEV